MHFTGNIYRPPLEANTPLLEITYGCSWNQCSFCSMYRNTKFGTSPIEDIESDLKELNKYSPEIERIFLVNGDALTLPYEKLTIISKLIHKYLPNLKTISCYASIRNIRTKTVEELKKLHEEGFDEFYIGLETANDYALKLMNKGYTSEEEQECLLKLEQADISYNAIVMFGITGRGCGKEHIIETAHLLNRYKPKVILSMSTSVQKQTPLEKYRVEGIYEELTEREMIEEELLFLKELEMEDNCLYFGSHPYNLINITNYFINKENMINKIENKVQQIDKENPGLLDRVLSRGSL